MKRQERAERVVTAEEWVGHCVDGGTVLSCQSLQRLFDRKLTGSLWSRLLGQRDNTPRKAS